MRVFTTGDQAIVLTKIKLATNDDDTMNEITIEGNDEEIERIWRTLNLQEKGMVRVEGIMG